ncbi:amino acid/polyamine transporter I, partial [Endogone sp. FLAS-F59071]
SLPLSLSSVLSSVLSPRFPLLSEYSVIYFTFVIMSNIKRPAIVEESDEAILAKLGYKQELSRSISGFSNFAISFGCLSVLAGLTPLYGSALLSGGTVVVTWGWLIVACLTMFIGLSLAEICSAFPTTGGLYFWVSRLATSEWVPLACWLTGWFNWLGLVWLQFIYLFNFPQLYAQTNANLIIILETSLSPSICWENYIAVTSTDLSLAQFMTGCITVVNPNFTATTYIQYAIFLAIVIVHGLINSVGVRASGIINQVSVYWHIFGVLIIIIVALTLTPNKASPQFVFGFLDNNTGFSSDGYAFLLGLLQSQYTLSGYDAAAHMSEETKRAQRGSPYGILFSIAGATVVGWVFLLSITFCIQDFATQIASPNAIQPQMVQVFLDGVGLNWAVVFCVIIMGGMFFCGSALTLGSSRMVYAFSRDGAMPLSKYLHTLNPWTKAPTFAVWFNILVAAIIPVRHRLDTYYFISHMTKPAHPVSQGIPFMWSAEAFQAIVSVNTIASSISYLIPILLRITLARDNFQPGPFNLGRWSVPIGIVSSLWIILTSILFICPVTYPVTPNNMNYAIVPFVFVIGISSGYFAIWGRKWFKGPINHTDEDDTDETEKIEIAHKA